MDYLSLVLAESSDRIPEGEENTWDLEFMQFSDSKCFKFILLFSSNCGIFFSIIVNSQLWKSQVSLGYFKSNYFWTLNCSRWTNNGWTSLPSYNQTPILHSRFPADQLQCVLNWLLSFKVIHLSLNNTGLHNKIKVVVPLFYTHICRYIHLTWDKLKYKAKVKQNNIYSYWSDVGSSDGDRDLLRYGHNFLLLVQCHPF